MNMLNNVDPDIHFYNSISHNCKYYRNEQIKTLNKADHMSIMHLHCRSLYANFEYVKEYLNKLDVKFNVVALSETWINENKYGNFKLDD